MNFARLDEIAGKMSDTEWARKMATAKATLLRKVKTESPVPPQLP